MSNIILANQTAYNVSKLLDSLLQDYDNSLRPDFAGNLVPTQLSAVLCSNFV